MEYKKYLLIEWPEVQNLMELEGFEEHSVLSDNASYFVEEEWYEEVKINIEVKEIVSQEGVISLPNRYKNNLVLLVPVNKRKYRYKLVTNAFYVRGVYDAVDIASLGEAELYAVDPEGGPYITIGTKIGDREVTSLEYSNKHNSYIITL